MNPEAINEAVRAMEEARSRKDWASMERICRDAVNNGVRLEYLVRSLSWALCRQGKTGEGMRIAELNYQWNPGVWSVINYIEAALDDGENEKARQAARHLLTLRRQWGENTNNAENVIERASSKLFRLVWTVPPHRMSKGDIFWLPKPMNTLNQKLISWKASGCATQEESSDRMGNQFVVAKPIGSIPLEVVTEVRLSPLSLKPLLSRVRNSPPTPDVAEFLQESRSRPDGPSIDPRAPEIQSIARQLRARNATDSAEKIMDWINANFTFCPPGSPPGEDRPLEVIKRKGGHCEAITSVEASLLRAVSIPARMIRCQSAVRRDVTKSTQHTIIQFWLSGIGWVDWDYFIPRWKCQDDVVRLWVYNSVGDRTTAKLVDFFGRSFQELKGYHHTFLGSTLE